MKILMVRHGQTDSNIQKIVQGSSDVPLNDTGIEQAYLTKEKLKDHQFDVVISSPLLRAKKTAEIITGDNNSEIIYDDRLKERHFGDFEGVSFDNNSAFNDKVWSFNPDVQLSSGESYFEFFDRVKAFFDYIVDKYYNKTVLLVSHGGVSIAARHHIFGIPESNDIHDYILGNCEIAEFSKKEIDTRYEVLRISKSKYIKALQCQKMYWLDKFKPELFDDSVLNDAVLEMGSEVGQHALKLFDDVSVVEYDSLDMSKMITDTQAYIERGSKYIAEASFAFHGRFLSVDILQVDDNEIEIFEVKSSTGLKDVYIDDAAYQCYVLKKLGYTIKRANIVTINNEYIRHGDIDYNKLFSIEDVTEQAYSRLDKVEKMLDELVDYYVKSDRYKNEPQIDIGLHCFDPYPCGYFGYCTEKLPAENVFSLRNITMGTKFDLYNKGLYSFEEIKKDASFYKLRPATKMQLLKEKAVDVAKIRDFIKDLQYPICHLDFETVQYAIPQYDNTSPYKQIPFQYSLHIEHFDGTLEHKEYLAPEGIDHREQLIRRLISDAPENACFLAYNMSFEKGVINNLAYAFPQYYVQLMNINNNMKDLMIPFKNRWYYEPDMSGSYSIKAVLPALFPDDQRLNYENLEGVKKGEQAMSAFKSLLLLDKADRLKVREQLLEYCKLDTYAMVMILNKLREMI